MLRALFVMEQPLGNRTYYLNLRHYINSIPHIEAKWVEVSYYTKSKSLWDRIPLLPGHLRSSLVGRSQVLLGLQKSSCDVVLFHTQSPAALAGKIIYQKPFLISTDMTPIQNTQTYSQYGQRPLYFRIFKWFRHKQYSKLFYNARRIISWTNWARSSLISDYSVDANKVEVLPPGIDLKKWQPDHLSHDGPLRILFVGSDFHRKGGELLLSAFRTLPEGMSELIIVTKTSIPPEPGITLYQNIKPNSPELIALFKSSDLFVFPSKAEAFGIAAVEASASELPIIATSVGGLKEVVVHNETGMLIEPDDQDALVENIRLIAENPNLRKQLGQAGRAHVEAHFNGFKNANRLVNILGETKTLSGSLSD
jgi:glycosyltransferase involved in cell wall biosynthesis